MTASLTFRVGMADETWSTAGWTHLVEHLAAGSVSDKSVASNASTSLIDTTFQLQGPPAAVMDGLATIAHRLGDDAFPGLAHEATILQQENRHRGTNLISHALAQRFGAAGPGLVHYGEPGLPGATEQSLREHARHWFTAENAVLVVAGDLPADFRLGLPRGNHRPPTEPEAIVGPRHVWYPEPAGGEWLAASGRVERTWATGVMVALLSDRFVQRFRHELAWAYAPEVVVERIGAATSVVMLTCRIEPQHQAESSQVFMEWLDEVGKMGFTQPEVDEFRAQRQPWEASEQSAFYRAVGEGYQTLAGEGVDAGRRMEDVTADDVNEQLRHLVDSLFLGLPPRALVPPGFRESQAPMAMRPDEPFHPLLEVPADEVLGWTWGSDQVYFGARSGRNRMIHPARVQGVTVYPDGGLLVVDHEGFPAQFEPALLKNGDQLATRLLDEVPATAVTPGPPRDPREIPTPASARERLTAMATKRVLQPGVIITALLLVGLVFRLLTWLLEAQQ
ncbi:hypothetical protein ACSDQ9_09510 [Aestuariimicrobium soli]|uniref:hypothetical protein n=1 Tax=Aestuariimicrobium soli TaxID=2035834 RepID=UPI003EBFA04D